MKIILYNNHSENNKLNKTIVKIVELQGYLREQTSLVNPQIMIEFHPDQFEGYVKDDNQVYVVHNGIKITWDTFINNYVLSANYVYIPDFNRYYFINDITSVRQNLWRLSLHVDVLMSYKNEINNTNAFVSRNEFNYDPMVRDDEISYYYDKDVVEFIPEKGDKVNKTFNSMQSIITNNVVLNVINDSLDLNLVSVNPPDPNLPVVASTTTGDDMTSESYLTYGTMLVRLAKRLQQSNESNLSSFILSIMVYPFTIDSKGSDFYLKLGDTELSDSGTPEALVGDGVYVTRLNKEISEYFVIADFTISGDTFMNYEPYSQYEIYLPYLGWVSLSADNILNNRLIVYYVVNYSTGSSQVAIFDTTNNKIIYTNNVQLGVKMPINSTNAREVNDQRNSNNIGLGVGMLTSAVAIIGGALTYNPVAVAGGVINAGTTIAKYVQNQNTNYLRASGSVGSGQSGLYLPQDVRIRKTSYKPKGYDENYFKLKGRPLNQVKRLADLTGFTIIGEEHLENFGSATKQEIDEIETLLKGGVIL